MCANSLEDSKKIRKFTYLLNNKELGKTSKEYRIFIIYKIFCTFFLFDYY